MIDVGEAMVADVLQARPPQCEHESVGRLDGDLSIVDAIDQQ
jgi:hypothetical protein